MRYETIVEITPDGQPALRLVIVPDPPVRSEYYDEEGMVIIPAEESEEDRGVVTWQM